MTLGVSVGMLLALAGAPSETEADSRPLQVAIVVDSSVYVQGENGRSIPESLLAELTVFMNVVQKGRPQVQFAAIGCRWGKQAPLPNVLTDFGPPNTDLSIALLLSEAPVPSTECGFRTDTLSAALEILSWDPQIERHVLVVAGSAWGDTPPQGKRTFEEVIHDAEHGGFVVHALTQSAGGAQEEARVLMADLEHFVRKPTWPIGRTVSRLRHGALWTGGSHSVSVVGDLGESEPATPNRVSFPTPGECARDVMRNTSIHERLVRRYGASGLSRSYWRAFYRSARGRLPQELQEAIDRCASGRPQLAEARARAGLDAMYGPANSDEELDVLAQLARGHRRPSDVREDEKPGFLRGVALEPLMDAVYDFVDARSELEALIRMKVWMEREEGHAVPVAGYTLGKSVLVGVQPLPSRR